MSDDSPDLARRAFDRRKREDSAMAIPALGLLLLVSPILNVFAGPSALFGVPAPYVYVFLVWAGLILLTRALALRLKAGDDRGGAPSQD